jgi:hypothetical protein
MLALGASLAFAILASVCEPAALGQTAPASGAAAMQGRFKAIRIDVSALAAKGLAPEASWLTQDLPAPLHTAFSGHLAPGVSAAPTLVVRIDGVYLGMSGGAGTAPFGDNAARDGIEGAAVVLASNGKPIATFPLFTTVVADTGGAPHELDSVRGRVTELAKSFAYWLPGQMGL